MATPMTRPFPSFEPVSPPLAGGREEEIYGEGEDADVVYRVVED
jgi:hypothetical protein